jgi:hypothetical protein
VHLTNGLLRQTSRFVLFCLLIFLLGVANAYAQVQPRVIEKVNGAQRVTLVGNTHPLARPEFDRGVTDDGLPMRRILLLLKRSDAQEAALQDYLAQQLDKNSSNYHAWLTPEEFGAKYGPADTDIQAVTQWLTVEGFRIEKIYKGKTVIEFSGTSGQVRASFATEIHNYQVNGKTYIANSSDPHIPAALEPVVAGIISLNNFPRKPLHHTLGVFKREKQTAKARLVQSENPDLTFHCGSNANTGQPIYCNALVPYDFATIYNLLPLWQQASPIDGKGQTIAIVAESNINIQDVTNFRSSFGLPAYQTCTTPPTAGCLNVILNGPDPGVIAQTETETEADLDVEWSGGVAPNAMIDLVVSESTESSSGVDLSSLFVVDNDLAPVMSVSYGNCELFLGAAGNQFFNNLWQQAAAQGISVFVASGDNGSAGCDFYTGTSPEPASSGFAVSGLASTPYNIAVGGTDFNDILTENTYWTTSNDPTTQKSVLGFIPEVAWNESCSSVLFSIVGFGANPEVNCNNTKLASQIITVGGGGGQSNCTNPSGPSPANCTGGYAVPSWQSGLNVPLNGGRSVPDVSLFSGGGFSGNAYAVCEVDKGIGSTCQQGFIGVGGTSAASPTFAAIMALVNQKTASREGNAGIVLYKLASKQAAATCNSSSAQGPASACIFNDVTTGGNAMPCVKGTPDCTVTNGTEQYGVLSGFSARAGYDLATGLGSVNVANLVNTWSSVTFLPSNTTLTVNGSAGGLINIVHGTTASVNSTVTAGTGASGLPTGQVALMATPNPTPTAQQTGNSGPSLGIEAIPLTGGTASSSNVLLPGGTYTLTSHYQGDAIFGASDSKPGIPVTVAAEPSKTLITIPIFDPKSGLETSNNPTSLVYGSPYIARIDVGNSQVVPSYPAKQLCVPPNCPTGTITWTDSVNNANPVPLDGGTFSLNSGGYTEDVKIQLSGGSHLLSATYNGDNSFKPSSATYSISVSPASMQLTLTVPTSAIVGATFVVSMEGTTNVVGAPPMGTLSVYDGGTQVFTTTGLGGFGGTGSGSGITATAGFAIGTGITLSSTIGAHSLTMTYTGDPNYSAPSTGPQIVNVVYPTVLTVQSPTTTVSYGTSTTLNATLTTTQTSPLATGKITFSSFSGQQTIVVGPTTQTTINGFTALQASATITPQSSDLYTASYAGDSNYSPASTTSQYITVNNPDFNVVPSQSGLTITAGQSANLTINVTPAYALNSSVLLQLPSPTVQGITCSVSPSQIPLSGAGTVTAMLTCTVPAPSSSNSATRVFPSKWPKSGHRSVWWPLSALLAILAIVFWFRPAHLRLRRLAHACLLLGAISYALGCGGGAGGGTGGGTRAGGSGGGAAAATTTTLTVANTKISTSNLAATVQVTGANSPTGTVSLGVLGDSWSFGQNTMVNGVAQYSYYLGAPGVFPMMAQYSGDARNLPSQLHAPMTIVQTGLAGNMSVSVTIGPTTKQIAVPLTIQ